MCILGMFTNIRFAPPVHYSALQGGCAGAAPALEALKNNQSPNIVHPKEHAVGTAAILDFVNNWCRLENVKKHVIQYILQWDNILCRLNQ